MLSTCCYFHRWNWFFAQSKKWNWTWIVQKNQNGISRAIGNEIFFIATFVPCAHKMVSQISSPTLRPLGIQIWVVFILFDIVQRCWWELKMAWNQNPFVTWNGIRKPKYYNFERKNCNNEIRYRNQQVRIILKEQRFFSPKLSIEGLTICQLHSYIFFLLGISLLLLFQREKRCIQNFKMKFLCFWIFA